MTQDQPFLVRHADLVFAFKTLAASMLAFVIALWIDLPRPYWAMATVYITSQPLAGATSSKALYRILGTLAGAAASVLIIPNLVDAPELLCLAVALWLGLCLYLSLIDGTPRSYAFMLAGYTVALIGLPTVTVPDQIFDTALARVQEISLGIICASVVSTIIFPRSVAPAVAARVDAWLATARAISQDVLAGHAADGAAATARLRLATEAVEIEMLETHLAYDRLTDADTAHGLRMLRRHMLMLLPLLASINDRMAALGERVRTDPALAGLIAGVSDWIGTSHTSRQPARNLKAAIDAHQPRLGAESSWDRIMVSNLLSRLRELVEISEDCRALSRAIATGRDPSRIRLAFNPEAGAAPARHRDHAVALWSAAGAAVAVLIGCAFWIATGWTDGASAPMMAAVACCFFASQDDPSIGIRSFAKWSLVSILIVGVYLFGLLPQVSNIEILLVMLAPAFLLFGFLIARPATTFIGMALAANTATLMALQQTYGTDFVSFANSSIAVLFGMSSAAVITAMARSFGAEWMARRLMRTGWVALAVAAERRGKHDRAVFVGVTLNRLGQLVQRLAAIPESDRGDVANLSQLRVGLNIIDLRRARHQLTQRTLRAIDHMLDELATALRQHQGGPVPEALLAPIDAALAEAVDETNPAAKEQAMIGLVGIRRGLFPDAAPYRPHSEPSRRLVA